jgi:hypothetical protein
LREYPFKFSRRFKKSSEGGDGGAESASRTVAESDNRLDFTGIVPQSSVFTLGREKLTHERDQRKCRFEEKEKQCGDRVVHIAGHKIVTVTVTSMKKHLKEKQLGDRVVDIAGHKIVTIVSGTSVNSYRY